MERGRKIAHWIERCFRAIACRTPLEALVRYGITKEEYDALHTSQKKKRNIK